MLLAGLALGRLWHAMRWTSSPARAGAALMATLLLLSPAVAAQWRRAAEAATVQAVAAEEYTRNGQGLRELLQEVHRRDLSDPGRAYAGTSWDWGKDYRLAGLPMYLYWGEADISAISYMFHSASLNSELEVEFDRTRKASYDLFNIRYMFTYNPSFLPPFAQTFATRPGVHAARIDTPGYFDFVGADLFLSGRRATRRELYEFNRRFVRGPLHAQGRFVRIGFGAHDGPLPGEREITSTDALSPDEAWRAPRGAIVASWGHNDHFGATVRAEEPGYVLFRMTYHPGWRATVDGRPADTVMLSPSFLGIPVTPGAHQIEVRYRPGAWTTMLFYAGRAVLGLSSRPAGRRERHPIRVTTPLCLTWTVTRAGPHSSTGSDRWTTLAGADWKPRGSGPTHVVVTASPVVPVFARREAFPRRPARGETDTTRTDPGVSRTGH